MAVRDDVFQRAGGRCECTMTLCNHPGRCPAMLRGEWAIHRLAAGGPYLLSNIKGLCQTCHRHMLTYGTGKR